MANDIHTTMTLGEIAAAFPGVIPALEQLGLDYCCRGGRTLAGAVEAAGLDLAAVLTTLRTTVDGETREQAEERDWRAATMTELADHIEATHHAFVRDAMEQLSALLPKVIEAHGSEHGELRSLAPVVDALADDLRDHMVREERVLFPWLRRLERKSEIQGGPPWSVRRPIDCMVHDHDEVAIALGKIRELTAGYQPPPGACPTYTRLYGLLGELERDTHVHIHKENNILFPAGVRAEAALKQPG